MRLMGRIKKRMCTDESRSMSGEVHAYLYDFPDPGSKVGMRIERKANETHRSAHLRMRHRVRQVPCNRDWRTTLTSQDTCIESGKSMI
jgi:hypothetical protein